MYPEIDIGPLTLQTFGLMFALAFLAAGALIWRRLEEIGKPPDWAYEMSFAALVGGDRRLAPLLPGRELRRGQRRPARQPLLRLRAGLVRRRDRRRDRGPALGLVPRLPRPRAARPRGAGAGARLRDRARRLPALRRRRLRQGLGRALGDGLPRRHRADRRGRSTRRRSTRRWRWASAPGSSGSCATASAPAILFAIYLLYAGAERFLVEFVRRNDDAALGLTPAQLESLAMMLAGAVWIAVVKRRHGSLARPGAERCGSGRSPGVAV